MWRHEFIRDGTAQGDTASTPAFSRGLRMALDAAFTRLRTQGVWVHIPSLVDDMLLITSPEHVDIAVGILSEELRDVGLQLNLAKCACYVPERGEQGLGEDTRITCIPQVPDGLPALGSAYCGEYAALLRSDGAATAPARKRLDAARLLAAECASYSKEQWPEATHQAAWHVLQSVAAKALAYDMRVLEPAAGLPLGEVLDAAVETAAKTLLRVGPTDGWTEDQKLQLQWPINEGGMAFGSAVVAARVARLAAVAQCLPTTRQHLAAILPDAVDEIVGAVRLDGVREALQWLRDTYGIEVGVSGVLARDKEPRWDPGRHFQSIRSLGSTLMRAIQGKQRSARLAAHAEAEGKAVEEAKHAQRTNQAAAAAARAEASAHQRHQVRLRSVAGEGAHEWVRSCPSERTLQLNDSEFQFGVRWRLGLPVCSEGACMLRAKSGANGTRGPCCGQARDRWGDHAVLCGKGPGRYRVHGALCRCLCRFAGQSRVEAEAEVVCPQLLKGQPGAKDAVEARLDVYIWSSGPELLEEWVDVTATHPRKATARKAAAVQDGVAVEAAESKKRKRYGEGVGGVSVSPAGSESWGRLGVSALSLLERLASQHATTTGAVRSRTLQRWKAELGVALVRALAETVTQAQRPAVAGCEGVAMDSLRQREAAAECDLDPNEAAQGEVQAIGTAPAYP